MSQVWSCRSPQSHPGDRWVSSRKGLRYGFQLQVEGRPLGELSIVSTKNVLKINLMVYKRIFQRLSLPIHGQVGLCEPRKRGS